MPAPTREERREEAETQTAQPQPEILLEALRGQADIALVKLCSTTTSKNPSIKGASREEVIREFMRCFLPDFYAIGHGEVFSERNERSKQVDVIIHDDLFSPVFKTANKTLFCDVFGKKKAGDSGVPFRSKLLSLYSRNYCPFSVVISMGAKLG